MSSAQAFNSMLYQFVEELSQVFPAEPKLRACLAKLPLLTDANPRKAMQVFLETYTPFAAKITAQDETLFDDVPTLCEYIDVRALWAQADQGTRSAIWQYLGTLFFMASTVTALPPELLSQIETVALSCAGKIEAGELDMAQLLSSLPAVMGQLGLNGSV